MVCTMNEYITRVFKNGNSQAVRIPAELRLNSDRVQIFKNEQGDLVIHPMPVVSSPKLGDEIAAILADFPDDFIETLERNQKESASIFDASEHEPL